MATTLGKAVLVGLTAAALTGGGIATGALTTAGTPQSASHVATQGDGLRTQARWHASRAWVPANLSELNEASAMVITGDVTGTARTVTVNGVPFTIHTVRVQQTHTGRSTATVQVRELGDGREPTSLVPGTTHVLHLAPFEMTRGTPTGEFVIAGGFAGDYRVDTTSGKGAAAVATRVDPDAPGLPATTTVGQLLGAAR